MKTDSEPPAFECRAVAVEPGGVRIYNEAEWRDAIVVVGSGEIELEVLGGNRERFQSGDVLCFSGLPLRSLHNRGAEPAVLVSVSRR
jgi:quercetin dioxygenase-like cupin family protein